jgi:alkanesulfonate monooxygenase SsuD/methylene tetrahydromethanopterin reductase-like flavin-dependent oxidoreductase (luciferase family)
LRFGVFCELQLPRPWTDGAERKLYENALEHIEIADRIGFDYVWAVEHHFLEEYSHSSAPEVFLAAAGQRTKRIRLGHGAVQMAQAVNHPARVAERIAALDIVSGGRVDFGTGEPSSPAELGGFGVRRDDKRAMSEDAIDAVTRMFVEEPFAGWDSPYLRMPVRTVVPKPLQKPHPPLWVACSKRETIEYAARRGVGVLSFSFVASEFARRWVRRYYELLESEECVPAGFAVNPNFNVVLPMMCHENERTAIERGADGAQFFSFALRHYYSTEPHLPGRTNLWEEFTRWRAEQRTGRHVSLDHRAADIGELRSAVGTPEQLVDLIRRCPSPSGRPAACPRAGASGRPVVPPRPGRRPEGGQKALGLSATWWPPTNLTPGRCGTSPRRGCPTTWSPRRSCWWTRCRRRPVGRSIAPR